LAKGARARMRVRRCAVPRCAVPRCAMCVSASGGGAAHEISVVCGNRFSGCGRSGGVPSRRSVVTQGWPLTVVLGRDSARCALDSFTARVEFAALWTWSLHALSSLSLRKGPRARAHVCACTHARQRACVRTRFTHPGARRTLLAGCVCAGTWVPAARCAGAHTRASARAMCMHRVRARAQGSGVCAGCGRVCAGGLAWAETLARDS